MSAHKLTPAEEAAYRELAEAAKRLREAQARAQQTPARQTPKKQRKEASQ